MAPVSALYAPHACGDEFALHDTAMRASLSTHMIEHWPGKIAPKTALPSIAASVHAFDQNLQHSTEEAARDLLVEGPSIIVTGRTVSL